ncbi:hypothetical protein [Micromonospora inyonensis]|nr:hypothetical protein [Micromonospora inyonensis]
MEPAPGGSLHIFYYSLALFGTVWALFAVPFVYHVVRAVRARNAWLPFERKPNGRYTFMAQHRWYSAFRAPGPGGRTATGLIVRYGTWLAVVAMLSYLPLKDITYILTH